MHDTFMVILSVADWKNIIFPQWNHSALWTIFLITVVVVLCLYAIPYIRKPRKVFRSYHVGIPLTNIISLYIFTKLLEGVVYQGSILKIDTWINEMMFTIRSPFLTSIASFITSFGSGIPIVLLLLVALTILLLRKRWRFAILATIAMVSTTLLQALIKVLVGRARPLNNLEALHQGNFSASFPSGHAITAIVFVSLLVYSFRDDIKHVVTKYTLIVLTSSFFVIVGLTRIYLCAHWFSDVLAGMALGLFWFMFIVLVERSITGLITSIRKESKEAPRLKSTKPVKAAKKILKE